MSIYPGTYTTLDNIRARKDITLTVDDNELIRYIRTASEAIELNTDIDFVPYYQAKSFDYPFESRSRRVLSLDTPLLDLESAADASGTLSPDAYVLQPYNIWPKWSIVLKNNYPVWQYNDEYLAAITVTGTWGEHRNPNVMFSNVTTLAADISTTTETTITIADAGTLSTLDYLRIGTEYMQATAVNGTTITVERGVRGTTAQTHTNGDSVARYLINNDVREACEELVIFLYDNRDKVGIQNVQVVDVGILVNQQTPRSIIDSFLARYKYVGGANV